MADVGGPLSRRVGRQSEAKGDPVKGAGHLGRQSEVKKIPGGSARAGK